MKCFFDILARNEDSKIKKNRYVLSICRLLQSNDVNVKKQQYLV